MRVLMLALALLAGLKIWAQDSVYRTATEQALISAYRDRAIEACRKLPARADGLRAVGVASGSIWSDPASVELAIGNRNVSVYLWEIDNPQWEARNKSPYLVLAPADNESVSCAYDSVAGTAEVIRS